VEAADSVSRSEVGCPNQDWTQALKTPRGRKPLGGLVGRRPRGCLLSGLRVFSQQLWWSGFQRVLPPILSDVGRQRWGPAGEKWRGVGRVLNS